jgi:putative NIF3 family GTP cyclohydrolase 1 type 2
MTIQQIYNLAIKMGIENDLRGKQTVMKKLKKEKEKFEELKEDEKEEFDQEYLTNPYSDTRILFGDPSKKIKRIMVGIDISVSDLLLAKELSKDNPIDLVICHHPLGEALADLHSVMDLQIELLAKYGLPINIAEKITKQRISEVGRALSPGNFQRVVQAAKLLDIPLMCTHTIADNCVANFLEKVIRKSKGKLERVSDLIKILKNIPEYKEASKQKQGPTLFAGDKDNYCGKIVLTEITGGTNNSKDIYERMAHYGFGTIVGMHMKEDHKKEAEKAHINVVIAGHMSSDSLGMNLFLDELEKQKIQVLPCSGLIRIKRFKK